MDAVSSHLKPTDKRLLPGNKELLSGSSQFLPRKNKPLLNSKRLLPGKTFCEAGRR
jgi:hypothetical protein